MPKLNVQFNEKQTAALERMVAELQVGKGRVLALALSLLEVARREERDGGRLAVVRDGAVVKEIVGLTG